MTGKQLKWKSSDKQTRRLGHTDSASSHWFAKALQLIIIMSEYDLNDGPFMLIISMVREGGGRKMMTFRKIATPRPWSLELLHIWSISDLLVTVKATKSGHCRFLNITDYFGSLRIY